MTAFLSCDWGSTSFRLRLVEGRDVAGETTSELGATVLSASLGSGRDGAHREHAFADHLERMIDRLAVQLHRPGGLSTLPVVLSGMVTSAHGWMDLPYADVPFALDGSACHMRRDESRTPEGTTRHLVFVSGVASADDVMRGEECELVGLFADESMAELSSDCTVLLPGTHCKHVTVRGGAMTDFRTFMTGELYAVLSEHSVLGKTVRHGTGAMDLSEPDVRKAFVDGVASGASGRFSGRLFSVRVAGLFGRLDPTENAARLSGLLIGDELTSLIGTTNKQPLVLAAGHSFAEPYRLALATLGLGERLTLVGPDRAAALSALGHARILSHVMKD